MKYRMTLNKRANHVRVIVWKQNPDNGPEWRVLFDKVISKWDTPWAWAGYCFKVQDYTKDPNSFGVSILQLDWPRPG